MGRPVDQGDHWGPQENVLAAGPVASNGGSHFGKPLVDPGLLGGITVPVDGVLQLMGKDRQIRAGPHPHGTSYVNYFPLVAVLVNADGILVHRAEVSARSRVQSGMQDGKVRVVVHAGCPLSAENRGNPGIYLLLEDPGGALQVPLGDARPVFHVPVGVGSNQTQGGLGCVDPQFLEVRHPESVQLPWGRLTG